MRKEIFEEGGMRNEEGDYSGGGLSALRVSISPPKLGGVRGGLNERQVSPSSDHPALQAPLLTQEGKRLLFRQKTLRIDLPHLVYSRTSVPPRLRAPEIPRTSVPPRPRAPEI